MHCPFCRHVDTRVLDSRDTEEGFATRRRRECAACRRRFTTYERVEGTMLTVRKKDGRVVPFEAGKIRAGIEIACEKRPVTAEQIDEIVLGIENALRDADALEVTSEEIGRRAMSALRELDKVAFVRFASVYEQFAEVANFVSAVESLGAGEAEEQPPADATEPRPLG